MLVDLKEIKFKELAEAVRILNESGLIAKQILTVGATKEVVVKAFVEGVQSVPDDAKGNWTGPEEVAEYYSKIVLPDPKPGAAKKKEAKKEAASKEAKVPKEKKPLAEKGKSSIEIMKELLAKKATDAEINKVFTAKFSKKNPAPSADFIAKRIKIYKSLAGKK